MKWIDDVRDWWKFWSVQANWVIAALVSALIHTLEADPTSVLQFLATLPEPIKSWMPFITLVVGGVLPTLVRLLKQPKLTKAKQQ